MVKFWIGLIGLLCSLRVIAADPITMTVVKGSSQFVVTLPANPTTGFQWTVVNYDKSKLQLTGLQYVAPKTTRIGAGGHAQFSFKLLKSVVYPSTMIIQFKYARAWEKKAGIVQSVTVILT